MSLVQSLIRTENVGGRILTQVARLAVSTSRNSRNMNRNTILICIPGNPGVLNFYIPFLDRLAQAAPEHLHQVVCIGFAGHDGMGLNGTAIFDLEQQIQHKIDFLDEEVARYRSQEAIEPQLVLMGHSIGAFISLQIMKRRPDLPIVRTYLLFPTIRDMWPQVRFPKSLLFYWGLRHFFSRAAGTLGWLPENVKRFMLTHIPEDFLSSALLFFEHNLVLNVLHLAKTEFDTVKELDHEDLRPLMSRLTLYYGQKDGWVPRAHYEDMKRHYPQDEVYLDESHPMLEHAFVLRGSIPMAEILSTMLHKHLSASSLDTQDIPIKVDQ
eukprot:TRINITY_DN15139_c0_g1::TRINITY_DN15139_c0_g1_i1::g.30694::m.30694 TRINITY_DN15139_c0_g1::TRINITY_DN15139_c0_g1_i1::g.30694  ORF type:complete len:341 (+),score=36.76,sp/Q5R7E8/LDAH_PONAB/31.76/4e-36,DUF2305/PF10230.4/1.2e-54,Abhydrolase_6/PF12697.2/3.2e-11,Abhydrolase_5/PF12695.2/2.8e-07,DUF1749/PF08538.5/0.047,Abhydrolase_1/PF00561.15/0.5 TRINITY_DN15139_c0_g1_i1:52-1023(+)